MPDGSYPIRDREELEKAIQAFGRAKDPDATKRWIIKRARQLKAMDALPDSWDVSGGEVQLSNPPGDKPAKLPPPPKTTKPAPKRTPQGGSQQQGKHVLPPGAVGWKHGWVPVNSAGQPVGPSQMNKTPQEIKDMAGHDQATRDAIAKAYQNKKTADAAKAAKKASSAAKSAASKKASAAKKAAHAKAAAQKKAANAKASAQKKAAATAQKNAAAQKKAHQQLVSQATKQALADKKAGRPLTPSQVSLIDAYSKQQATTLDTLRNHVSLSQTAQFDGSEGYESAPTVSSQDGVRGTTSSLLSKAPRASLKAAAMNVRKRRKGRGKGTK